jgi:hypothetical protein
MMARKLTVDFDVVTTTAAAIFVFADARDR